MGPQQNFLLVLFGISVVAFNNSRDRVRAKKQKRLMDQSWQSFIARFNHWNKRLRKRIVFACKFGKRTNLRYLTACCVILVSVFSFSISNAMGHC